MHAIACRPVVAGGFLQEKEAVAVELGGQPRGALQMLTLPLSKASPSAYSTYRNEILSCFNLNACDVLCTPCRVLG
jgi:hypothetical protein